MVLFHLRFWSGLKEKAILGVTMYVNSFIIKVELHSFYFRSSYIYYTVPVNTHINHRTSQHYTRSRMNHVQYLLVFFAKAMFSLLHINSGGPWNLSWSILWLPFSRGRSVGGRQRENRPMQGTAANWVSAV